ncbi:MAG: TonB-dependent receptor domain-containing protein [Acidobacteriota bacterium]
MRKPMSGWALLSVVVFAAVLAQAVWAQTTSTEVLGVVRDTTGGVLPGAQVTLTRRATGETRTAVTNDEGIYAFPLIEPGVYQVHFEMPGFKTTTVSGVNVALQQRARVNVTLQIGEVTEEIEVVGDARLLNTEDAAVGQNIESERIVELPVNSRNVGHLAILTPGVTFGGRMGSRSGMGGQTPPGTTVALVAHGQHEINQTVTLDGVDAKEPRIHTMSLMPSLDAIQEFKVQTAAYSAEYGLGGGAHVQISMKSGTNDFHGSIYEFHLNEALDAEDYFLNFGLAPGEERKDKDAFRRHQFGAFLSGPVILPGYDGSNRTFWSFNYEGRRELNESVDTEWFPSDAMRTGDFSELLNPVDAEGNLIRAPILIYDPLTGEPFPNNVIPQDRLNPGALNLLQFIPRQSFRQADPLDFTNREAIGQRIDQNAWFFRIDHNISQADRVFFRMAWDTQNWDRPTINPHFGLFFFNKPMNIASQWIHTFSPTVLNEFRFGVQTSEDDLQHRRVNESFDQDALGIGKFRVVGDGNRPLEGRENGIPPLRGLGFGFGDGGEGGGLNDMIVYQWADHLSIMRGKHQLKMGFEYRHRRIDRQAANLTRGRVNFSGLQSGLGFASFMMGFANSAETAEGFPLTIPRENQWSVYFLDNWQITSKLTANLGLRYDSIGVPVDEGGFWRTLDFIRTFETPEENQIPTVFPDALGEAGAVPLWEQDNRFFMPRIGLAYRPADKWVVRAGAGWYANVTLGNNFTILNLMPPFSGSLQFSSVMDVAQRIPVEAGGQTFNITTRTFRPGTRPLVLGDDLFPDPATATLGPERLLHVQPDRKNSSHWTWTFDVQRQLPLDTVLTVGYVGSKTSHVPNSIGNWNAADPSPDTNFQSRRPIQQFHDPLRPEVPVRTLGAIRFLDSGANAWYNGLTFSLDKRFSNGLAYGLAYTYSQALGEGSGGGQEGAPFQNAQDRRGSKGPQQHDRTHVTVVNFVYELPFMRNAGGVPGAVLGGWQLNGILAFRSGFPFTMGQGDNLNTGDGTIRPDRIADGRLENASREKWYEPQAFQRVTCNIPSRPDLCHYGHAGVGIIRTPTQHNLDLSLYKNFRLPVGPEETRLQLRLEAFNALNTPYFGNPVGIGFQTNDTIVPDAPRMGEIRSLAAPMRIIQVAAKVTW